jgi:uncharacterized protein YndB with AHSA1/START domain
MEVSREIEAPAERVWALLADPQRWVTWGPSVRGVDASAGWVEPGKRGRVRTPVGLWLPFEITAVDAGRAWRWRVAGVEATGHRVEPLGAGRCRAVFVVPGWAFPYGLVCRVALGRLARLAAGQPGPR